jgi:multiple sugar transport system substrate-binding protein
MRKALKAIMVLALAIIVSGAVWAAPVSLEFWTFDDWGRGAEGTMFKTFIDEFQKANPNITINFVAKPGNDIQSGLVTGAGSGTLPDVFTMGLNAANTLVRASVPEDLSAQLKAMPAAFANQFSPAAMNALKTGGKVYGLPFTAYGTVMFRNLTVLAKSGIDPKAGIKDLNDLIAQCKKIKAAGFQPLPDLRQSEWGLEGIIGAVGGKNGVNADGSTSITVAQVKAALDLYKQLIPYMNDISMWDGGTTDLLKQDKLAFTFNGPWQNPDYMAYAKSNAAFKYDYCNMPSLKAGVAAGTYGGEFFGVGKGSKHAAEAFKFIAYITDAKQAARFAALGRPVQNPTAMKDKAVMANPLNTVISNVVASGFQDAAWFAYWPETARKPFTDASQNVSTGMSSADAAAKCIEELNAILAEGK